MASIHKPPYPIDSTSPRTKVFLAGSIEQGTAENWQKYMEKELCNLDIEVYNPRRDNWDSTWEPNADNPVFREQVEWELDALGAADFIVMYLSPGTISPISLLELGLHASGNRLIVCCPEGFRWKGNVDIVCERYGIPKFNHLHQVAGYIALNIN